MRKFEIFVVTAPGLEKPLAAEIAEVGFQETQDDAGWCALSR